MDLEKVAENGIPADVDVSHYIRVEGASAIIRPDTPIEVWTPYTLGWLRIESISRLVVGDLIIFGNKAYGDAMFQVLGGAGYSRHTIENWISVAKAYAPSERHPNLTYTHHEVVAALPKDVREELLTRAEEEEWKTDQIKEAKKEYDHKDSGPPKVVERCPLCGHGHLEFFSTNDVIDALRSVRDTLEKVQNGFLVLDHEAREAIEEVTWLLGAMGHK